MVVIMHYRKPTVFISYDIENDSDLKDALIEESEKPESLFEVHGVSSGGDYTNEKWIIDTRNKIDAVDKHVVILGVSTHSDPRVAREVDLGMECHKFLLQFRIYGTNPNPMPMQKWNYVYMWEEKAFIQAFRPIELLDHRKTF
jgi:hypothetical protein|tara:strand:- start:112 stop:540 length:429 start_codon:yes stop_codon:yes gene_type:complete